MMNKDIDKLIDIAFDFYNKNSFDEAEKCIRLVLSISSSFPDAIYLLGLIAYQKKAFQEALSLLFQACEQQKENRQYQLALASVLQEIDRHKEALEIFKKFDKTLIVQEQIGFLYLKEKKYKKAEKIFLKILHQDEKNIQATIGLALIKRHFGKIEESIFLLEKMQETAERDYQLSEGYFLLKQNKKAYHFIKKAIKKEGNKEEFFSQKGKIELEENNFREALKSYERALEINPKFIPALIGKSEALQDLNFKDKAREVLEKAFQIDSKNIEVIHNLATLCYKQNEKLKALEFYRKVLLLNPKFIPSLYNLALAVEETEQWEEAVGLYFNLLSLKKMQKEISPRIAFCLGKMFVLGQEELVKNFTKGWIKHFPKNIFAQHAYKTFIDKNEKENWVNYIRNLYNQFAETYDNQMKKIESQSLKAIKEFIPRKKYNSILDLGCGTGDFGNFFSLEYKKMVGVDLSSEMLKKAKEKKRYTRLFCQEVEAFLLKKHEQYDLIVASDILGYIENIEKFFKAVSSHMCQEGFFVFTFELIKGVNYKLLPTGRFGQSYSFIQNQLKKSRLKILNEKEIPLRKEGGIFVKGYVILAQLI